MGKQIIGRNTELILVDFNQEKVPAKIDTGAFHSAIHANNIEETDTLKFRLLGKYEASTDDFSTTKVENSFGESETRYIVPLTVEIGRKVLIRNFTLADRSKKTFPILVGRELLNGEFIVDPEIAEIDRKTLKKLNVPNDEEGA